MKTDAVSGLVGETALRFVLGGIMVSLFAVVGTIVRPPTFAGMFGSAPSLAIATLTLAFAADGAAYVTTEARSMMIGALGLAAYGGACAWIVQRSQLPVWAGAALCWTTWLTVTLALWTIARRVL